MVAVVTTMFGGRFGGRGCDLNICFFVSEIFERMALLMMQMKKKLLLLPEQQIKLFNQFFQSIYCFIVIYRQSTKPKKTSKKSNYVMRNKFILNLSLFFDNYVVFTVTFVIKRNLRNFNRDFRQ